MKKEAFFPVFLDMSEKTVVIIGAGKIAARRIMTMLEFAGRVRVVAREISDEIRLLSGRDDLELTEGEFTPEHLDGADMVLAATNDRALNAEIGGLCRERGVPVNVCHDRTLCDFYFPGIAKKGSLVIGVSASGKDHAAAKEYTEKVRDLL